MNVKMDTKTQPPRNMHSQDFLGAESYFYPHETMIESFEQFTDELNKLQGISRVPLLWRGQIRASWGVHSSLFRLIADAKGYDYLSSPTSAHLPDGAYETPREYPTEDDLVRAEKRILRIAREEWRLESASALEIFARLQHQGGPTRLLDVSFNPLIAAWFSTLSNEYSDKSGRIIAFASKHPESRLEPRIQLDDTWGSYQPTWHKWADNKTRTDNQWGDGTLRRYWVPPLFDPRMQAQYAAFVVDGIPISSPKTQSSFRKPTGKENDNWRMADLIATGSLYMKMHDTNQVNKTKHWASTYTFRISPDAKVDIQNSLQNIYGYNYSSVYPDLSGLARYLNTEPELFA